MFNVATGAAAVPGALGTDCDCQAALGISVADTAADHSSGAGASEDGRALAALACEVCQALQVGRLCNATADADSEACLAPLPGVSKEHVVCNSSGAGALQLPPAAPPAACAALALPPAGRHRTCACSHSP